MGLIKLALAGATGFALVVGKAGGMVDVASQNAGPSRFRSGFRPPP